jgi:hypothetical protein
VVLVLLTVKLRGFGGYIGSDGLMPPLQVGGVQDAITFAAPTVGEDTLPTLAKIVLVVPETATEIGFVEVQVRGTPVIFNPRMSVTVASMVVTVPVLTTNEVAGFPAAWREMVWTGQV